MSIESSVFCKNLYKTRLIVVEVSFLAVSTFVILAEFIICLISICKFHSVISHLKSVQHTVQCRVIASVKAGSQYDAGSVSVANVMVIIFTSQIQFLMSNFVTV